jgi:Uma2 family endonuclease
MSANTVVSRSGELIGRPLTRAQYDTLVRAGAYEDQAVELLEGVVVDMAPQGEPHSNRIGRLNTRLTARLVASFGERCMVRPRTPLAAGPLSEPEPDLAVVDWDASSDETHPATAHLVVEVAQTSQARDLGVKSRIYADAGVTQYWVVDLPARQVVVHTHPDAADGTRPASYGTVRRLPLETELDVLGMPVRPADLLG